MTHHHRFPPNNKPAPDGRPLTPAEMARVLALLRRARRAAAARKK